MLNSVCCIRIRLGNKLIEQIPINTSIRQRDSLSLKLFNVIMDRIIDCVRDMDVYRMGNHNFNILCYEDDTVLILNIEDNLQRILNKFNICREV